MESVSAASVASSGLGSIYIGCRIMRVLERLDAELEESRLLMHVPRPEMISGNRLALVGYPANPSVQELSVASLWCFPCLICHLSVRLIDFMGLEISYGSGAGIVPHAMGKYPTMQLFTIELPACSYTVAQVRSILAQFEGQGWDESNYNSLGPKNCIEFSTSLLQALGFDEEDLRNLWELHFELRQATALYYSYKAMANMGATLRIGAAHGDKNALEGMAKRVRLAPELEDQKRVIERIVTVLSTAKYVSFDNRVILAAAARVILGSASGRHTDQNEVKLLEAIGNVLQKAAMESTAAKDALTDFTRLADDLHSASKMSTKEQAVDSAANVGHPSLNDELVPAAVHTMGLQRTENDSHAEIAIMVHSNRDDEDVHTALRVMIPQSPQGSCNFLANLLHSDLNSKAVRMALRCIFPQQPAGR